ncbi:MAG: peptidylprolyl isomerase [Candidatus Woesearchaeota archaeon]
MAKKKESLSIYFWSSLLLLLVLIFVLSMYFSQQHTKQKGTPAAYVNGEVITVEELERQYALIPEQYRLFMTKKIVLERMISNLLLYQEAKKKRIGPEPELAIILRESRRPYTEKEFKELLEKEGVSYEEYTNDMAMAIVIQKYVLANIPALEPSQELLDSLYEMYANGVSGTMYRARHILVATADEAKAIKEQLLAGASFAELAKERSLDPVAASQGGDLGWFSQGEMVPEFEQAVMQLKPGQLSDPVQTAYGYHIIQLDEVRQGEQITKEQVMPYLRFRAFGYLLQQDATAFLAFVETLRNNATITIVYNDTDADAYEISSLEDLETLLGSMGAQPSQGQEEQTSVNEKDAPTQPAQNDFAVTTSSQPGPSVPSTPAACSNPVVYFFYVPGPASLEMETSVNALLAQGVALKKINALEPLPQEFSCYQNIPATYPLLLCGVNGNVAVGKQSLQAIDAFVKTCLGT